MQQKSVGLPHRQGAVAACSALETLQLDQDSGYGRENIKQALGGREVTPIFLTSRPRKKY